MRQGSHRKGLVGAMEALERRRLFSSQSAYAVTSLISNGTATEGVSPTPSHVDSTLVDTWGLAMGPDGTIVDTNVTGYMLRLRNNGTSLGAHAIVAQENGHNGAATGMVYNSTSSFDLPGTSTVSTYILGTEGGNIVGWNPTTSVRDTSVLFSSGGSAQYEAVGLGVASVNGAKHNYLYATNFQDKSVDVFNSGFARTSVTGSFTDPNIPSNYSPFGLLVSGSNVFVTYCQLETSGDEDHPGAGLGILDEFTTAGVFERRLVNVGGPLDDPYGLAIAPSKFGSLSNDLLVGDFGDGVITGINLTTDTVAAQMKGPNGHVFSVDGNFGLWQMAFGNGKGGTNADALYFSAPTDNEAGGLVGYITPSGTAKAAATPAFATSTAITDLATTSSVKKDDDSDLKDLLDS